MNHRQALDLLEDFVDEVLPADDAEAVRTHVAACETCRAAVAEMRALQASARALPREIAPGRDLWPAIAAAIGERPRAAARVRRRWWPATAIATACVATAVLLIVARWNVGGPVPGAPDSTARTGAEPAAFDPSAELVQALEAECRAGAAELARYAPDPECAESSSIFGGILGEIRTIDTAISEVKTAWSSDPDSPQLVRLLASYYRAKAALQGRATQVASRVTC